MIGLIFKLQRGLNNNTVLIYDRKREYMGELPFNSIMSQLLGKDLKCYVSGKINEDGFLKIYRRVTDREW